MIPSYAFRLTAPELRVWLAYNELGPAATMAHVARLLGLGANRTRVAGVIASLVQKQALVQLGNTGRSPHYRTAESVPWHVEEGQVVVVDDDKQTYDAEVAEVVADDYNLTSGHLDLRSISTTTVVSNEGGRGESFLFPDGSQEEEKNKNTPPPPSKPRRRMTKLERLAQLTPDERAVVEYVSAKTGARYSTSSEPLRQLLGSGVATVEDCKLVVDFLAETWSPELIASHLNPESPFRTTKFMHKLAAARAWLASRAPKRVPPPRSVMAEPVDPLTPEQRAAEDARVEREMEALRNKLRRGVSI